MMFIHTNMITLLFIIFLGCNAVAQENEMCDRVQFSFDDQNTTQNFTKQSFDKNGQPVYYSESEINKTYDGQTIVWWNKEKNTWLSQTRPYSTNKITKSKISFLIFSTNNEQMRSGHILLLSHYRLQKFKFMTIIMNFDAILAAISQIFSKCLKFS